MSKRSFAGFVCEESLAVGLYGEVFHGRNRKGGEARVIVVEPRLSQRKSFAVALARTAGDVAELMHPHIVTTEKVGRGKDGSLVIIATAVESPTDLPSIVARSGGRISRDVGLSIAMGALRGLSHAHEHRVVHGGVHPRSVIIDGKGVSKLADFGLAYGFAAAAAKSGDQELLGGLRGFVAPELAHGQEPDQTADVFAGGALLASLLWGRPEVPSGESSALADVAHQAMSTDRMRRFANAVELESAVRAAIDADHCEIAGAARVQSYIKGLRGPSEAKLDAETEDLLASLDLGDSSSQSGASLGLDAALAGLDEEFAGLEDSVETAAPNPDVVDPLAGFADGEEDEELTAVDDSYSSVPEAEDALEEMIRSIPHPAVAAAMTNAPPRRSSELIGDDYDEVDETPLPVPRPFHQDHTHAVELVELVGRQAATSSPFDDDAELPEAPARSNSLRWIALIVFVLATLFAVAYTKTNFLRGAERENADRANKALEEIEKMQPKPGQITILSETEDAAVWLLVGRTPATSFALPMSMVHELRVEHEGYTPVFLSVGAQHWSGEKDDRKANLSATLLAAEEPPAALVPAFPPVPNSPVAPGGAGQGTINVESVPSGAEVWLLVGTTPEMTLAGIEAGKDYEFKVLKDGHKPAFAAFKEESWYLSGKGGPMKPILSETIVLEADEGTGPGGGAEDSAGASIDEEDDGAKRRKRRKRQKSR